MRYSPQPDRALRTSSPIAVVAEPDRALRTSSPIAVVRNPTARAVTLSVNPRQRRGHMHRGRAAADALLLYIYSGTALRCISPSPLYPRTRCPGLTENGSALRTTLPLTPSHRYPSPQRFADALFFRNPIRTERSGGRMGLLSPHSLGASEMRYHTVVTAPTARAVTSSVNPRQRRGTSARH